MAQSVAEQVRRRLAERELNRHRVAQLTGLSYSVVHRFMGGGDVMVGTLDRLCDVAGVTVTLAPIGGNDQC